MTNNLVKVQTVKKNELIKKNRRLGVWWDGSQTPIETSEEVKLQIIQIKWKLIISTFVTKKKSYILKPLQIYLKMVLFRKLFVKSIRRRPLEKLVFIQIKSL